MILRARFVVTMNGAPIENGAVATSDERIIDVGSFAEVKARNPGEIVDLGEQALLPGLINAHCHIDYTCLRGKIAPQKSFTDWIRAINAEKAGLSNDDYLDSINTGFVEAKRFGTTTIANLTAFPELISKIQAPIRTLWFAEMIDVRQPERAKEIVDHAVDLLRSVEHGGLAPHAPYTASANLYRYAEEVARRQDFLLTTHLAESSEEMQMFVHRRGPLQDFLAGIGRDTSDLKGLTPIEQLSAVCTLDERWLLVHLNELLMSDFELLAASRGKPQIVHCPRSHKYFGHSRFPFEKMRELGLNICLGTDSLASNSDLSLFAEMRALQESESAISPEEILEMVTVNSARALRFADKVGQIRPGLLADLIAIPFNQTRKHVFTEIVAFEESVSWMMIEGKMTTS
jgi:cytosine/adenosine deaminase-related metal-dependent hydrolase